MKGLKSCPFCGSKVEIVHPLFDIFSYECTNKKDCGATILFTYDGWQEDTSKSIDAFNRRCKDDVKIMPDKTKGE